MYLVQHVQERAISVIKHHLKPVEAATLADSIYRVNEHDPILLRDFLTQSIFRQSIGSKPTVMKAHVGGRLIRAATDAFGVMAYGAEGTRYANDLFLIFRGTTTANNKADFITDARLGLSISAKGKPVHSGFNQTFNSMRKQIDEFVAGQAFSGRVHCIGHSLGGAVATLAADWCFPHISKEVVLYTFGQPRVGLVVFSSMTTLKLGRNNIHRTFNTTDPVPMVPIFPYTHIPFASYGHRLETNHKINGAEAHRMSSYLAELKKLKAGTWTDVPRSKPLFNHEAAIEEYIESRRNENPMYPKTFEDIELAIHCIVRKFLKKSVEAINLIGIGVHTFIDFLAKELHRLASLANGASKVVRALMRKIMRILGMPDQLENKNSLQFFTYILKLLVKRANELARKAIRGIK